MSVQQRNNVHVMGEGPLTMVFSHAFGRDQNMWRLIAPQYAPRFRTVTFDVVGAGGSDLSSYDVQKYDSLSGYADDLLEVIDAFAQGPVVFVGHSVSAMVGLLAGIRAPEKFIGHVMVGPSPCYISDGDYVGGLTREDIHSLLDTLDSNDLGWASSMAPAIMGASNQPELGVELTQSFCRTDPDIAKQFARVTFLSDNRADLPQLQTATLIVQSSDDLIAPVAVGQYLQRSLPNATLRVVANVGHCPHLSAPCASADAMNEFLAALGH
jgi:sigma-B regulation protein RsbQ